MHAVSIYGTASITHTNKARHTILCRDDMIRITEAIWRNDTLCYIVSCVPKKTVFMGPILCVARQHWSPRELFVCESLGQVCRVATANVSQC